MGAEGMTPIADMVEKMLSGGVPPELIVLAVRTAELSGGNRVETPVDFAAENRRAWDRNRKREQASTRLSTRNSTAATLLTSLPSSTDSQNKKEVVVGRARGTRLAPDWEPTQADLNFAITSLPEARMRAEIEKFRDYWFSKSGKDATKNDWSATWRNWVRRASEGLKTNGKSRPIGIIEAADNLVDRIADLERGSRPRG
jgi:hypothetical protein